ncbi:MAG TPA: endonuclease/exonuclease/phosphatase family protein [Vicinamibacterales bacterium]|nr:endonuclease/exonuclease/phosphatase family protein [Vicinamibacterales bacterium]
MILKLLTYNIRHGGVGRERALASVINGEAPDLVMLQEARRPDVVQRLARATGMATAIAAPGRSVACISRVPVARYKWVRPLFSQHAFLEVVLDAADVRIFGVHLSAVHAAWTERRRVRELRSLLNATTKHAEGFHFLVGDFNTLAPNEALDVTRLPYRLRVLVWLSGGRIRWQTIAIMLGANYVDAFRTFDPANAGFTFPTWDPHIRLDYAFLPKRFAERLASCAVVRENPDTRQASDHFPLRIDVNC